MWSFSYSLVAGLDEKFKHQAEGASGKLGYTLAFY